MLALIAIGLPAVVMAVLWEKLFFDKIGNGRRHFIEYVCSVLIINVLDLLVVNYVARSSGNLIHKITEYSDFALKYICLSCLFAVGIPYLCRFWKDYVSISIDRTGHSRELPYRWMAVIYAIVLFGLNLVRVFDNNFWGDEAYSIRLAKMSAGEMIQTTAGDVHPPLYYLLLIGAHRLSGGQSWAYHMASILPYGILMVFIMTVIWKRFGKTTALFMVTFASIMNTAVTYNVEVRMYSLAALLMLLAYYGFYLIIVNGKAGAYIFFVLASLGAAYTHYYAMMSVAFFYLALLVMVITKRIKLWKMLAVYLATIIGYMPWFLTMVSTFKRTSEGFWMTCIPKVKDCLSYLFASNKAWYSYMMLALTIVLIIGAVVYEKIVVMIARRTGRIEIRLAEPSAKMRDMSFWLLWGMIAVFGTIVVGEAISVMIRPAFITRYLYPVVAVIWLVFSVAVSRFRHIRKIAAPILLIVTLAVCLPRYVSTCKTERELDRRCKATHEFMEANIGDGDVMLTNVSHLNWTVLSYYMPDVAHTLISAGYEGFEQDVTYWLLWSGDLSESDMDWLDAVGYAATEVYHAGYIGGNNVHIYQMEKEEDVEKEQDAETERDIKGEI